MSEANIPFAWGVSTSGYQHEGGYNAPGAPLNNWHAWEEKQKVEPSGRAVDFWNRYEEDFDRARAIGVNSFRLSVEWARIQPAHQAGRSVAPKIDESALDHYAKILVAARERGLEPLVTLQHFTHPAWLGPDPWLDALMANLFSDYVGRTVLGLNRRLTSAGHAPLRWLVTINEPNMFAICTYHYQSFPNQAGGGIPKLLRAFQTLLMAHHLAYQQIHALYDQHPDWGKPMVSFNNYSGDLYWLDKFLMDIVSSAGRGVPRQEVFPWLHERHREFNRIFKESMLPFHKSITYWVGAAVKKIHNVLGKWLIKPDAFSPILDLIYREPILPFDYVAFDYYDPFIAHAYRLPNFSEVFIDKMPFREWLMQSVSSKWWDWQMLPEGMRFFVNVYEKDFPDMPIIIAENGMAFRKRQIDPMPWRQDRLTRREFLESHVKEVIQMRREGKPLAGYFHWSLTDNYEWGSYEPRFGLYSVKFRDKDLPREPSEDHPERAYADLINTP